MNANRIRRLVLTLVNLTLVAGAWAGDPNVPPALSAGFAADWESVTLTVTGHNPITSPDGEAPAQREAITVTGNVYVFDTNDLIAVSTTNTMPLWAFDQDGQEILINSNAVMVKPARTWELGEQPKTFAVTLPLDPNQSRPTLLAEMDFTVEGLYGRPFRTVAIPVAVSEEWIELTPEYRVRITDANVVSNTCTVVIEEEITVEISGSGILSFDPNNGPWEENPRPGGHALPFSDLDIIVSTYLGAADGSPVGTGRGLRHSMSGMHTAATTGILRITADNCSSPEGLYVHHTFALSIYETPIPLTLTEVPVPGR